MMAIASEFRMEQYKDDDHRDYASQVMQDPDGEIENSGKSIFEIRIP